MKENLKYQLSKVFCLWVLLGVCSSFLIACDADLSSSSVLEKIKQEGVLHVVTYNSPMTYFEDRSGRTGFEYELVKNFADKLGVKLQIEQVNNLDDVYSNVENNTHFLGAANLVKTSHREQQVNFSVPYLLVDALVIYHKSAQRPTRIEDLLGKSILVIKGSSQADELKKLQERYPDLTYQESDVIDVIDLLQQVEDQKIDIVVLNKNVLAMTQVYYSNIRVGFSLIKDQPMAWIVAKSDDSSLIDAVNIFMDESDSNGLLDRLNDRFFGHIDVLGYVGAYSFAKHLQERLPKYEKYFVRYAKDYDLDWKLLAAIGYQESHWNPDAVSPTGVRGLMMLTQNTAKAMGVENRLDPGQSIMGGAKLFSILKEGVNKDIIGRDRIFFALAAYNMGQGHLADVQKIAELNNMNPNVWRDVNQVLPLIAQKQWYTQVRYGYARGLETKQFVRNIRRYYDILNWLGYSQREVVTGLPKLYVPSLSRKELSETTSLL